MAILSFALDIVHRFLYKLQYLQKITKHTEDEDRTVSSENLSILK